MASGDWAAYGEAQSQLNDALRRATEADDAIRGATGASDPAAEDGAAEDAEPAPEQEGTEG